MSVAPEEWSPGSRKGLRHDLGWFVLGIATFGVLALWEPFFIDVSPTTFELVVSIVLGTVFSTIVLVDSLMDAWRRIWEDSRTRFAFLCTLIMGIQVVLWVFPMWTVLTILTSFVSAVPIRLYLYRRATIRE